MEWLHEKAEVEKLIENVQRMACGLEKVNEELEKAERELDTVPHIDIYLAGVKEALERLSSLYYSTSLPLIWFLEDAERYING